MDPDHVGRQPQLVLHAADQSLCGEQHAEHRERLQRPLEPAAVALKQPHADHGDAEQRGDRGVSVDNPGQRVRTLEVESVDVLSGCSA